MSDWTGVFVTDTDVAPFTSSVDIDTTLELVNDLVGETWANPVDPVPARIRALALGVAVRALSNPKNVDSVTRSSDQTSLTDRYVARGERAAGVVYLTSAERRVLRGRRRRYGTVHTPRRNTC